MDLQSIAKIEQLRRSADAQETMAEAAARFVLDTPAADGFVIAPQPHERFASLRFDAQ